MLEPLICQDFVRVRSVMDSLIVCSSHPSSKSRGSVSIWWLFKHGSHSFEGKPAHRHSPGNLFSLHWRKKQQLSERKSLVNSRTLNSSGGPGSHFEFSRFSLMVVCTKCKKHAGCLSFSRHFGRSEHLQIPIRWALWLLLRNKSILICIALLTIILPSQIFTN